MQPQRRWMALAVLALAVALPGFAQEGPEARHPGRHRLRACLSILDLTEEQKTAISGILEAARPELDAALAAVREAREILRAALEADPPDACEIGKDALAVQSAVDILRQAREAVRGEITATLTPEQAARFDGCLDAPRVSAEDDAAE